MGNRGFINSQPVVKEPAMVCTKCHEIYDKNYLICTCETPTLILQSKWLAEQEAKFQAEQAVIKAKKKAKR
jgi:hypothetical protein